MAGTSADSKQHAHHSGWNKHRAQGALPEIKEGFLRVVMLELGFEGRNSLCGKLEKGLPDRGNSGEGLETDKCGQCGCGAMWAELPVAGTEDKVPVAGSRQSCGGLWGQLSLDAKVRSPAWDMSAC